MTDQADQLIAELAADLKPVHRLAAPFWRAVAWVAIALAVNTAAVILHGGVRADLMPLLKTVAYSSLLAATILTGILAALAVFLISIPGRSKYWAALPIPGVILWFAAAGYGCFSDWLRLGPDGLQMGHSVDCFTWIVAISLPLSLVLYFMVRHAAWIRPGPTLVLGMLSTAAFAATGLSLLHDLDTSMMIMIWHGGAVAILLGLSALGVPLFKPKNLSA
ncbi:MAG TPA: NrsF family protein [Dongiaceae bacterium]|nr:NrsF family protein [Dongiaceae bacterium]